MIDSPGQEREAASVEGAPRRRFSVQVAWTFAARLLMLVNSVGAGIIVARLLGAEALGALAVLNVAVSTVTQVSSAGLPSANTFFISRDPKSLAGAATNSLIFALMVGSLLAFALVALAARQPELLSTIPTRLIAIAALAIPFQLISLLGLNIFLALKAVGRFNLLDLAGQSFILLNAVLALIVLNKGLWMLVSLNTAAAILIGLLVVWMIGRYLAAQKERRFIPNARLFLSMLRYGLKYHVAILAAMLIFRADLMVVNYFGGASDAGVYAVASQIGMTLMLLPGVIATLLFPRISASGDAEGDMTCLVSRHTAFVMLLVCLAAVPGGFILPLLYGAPFRDVTVQLLILLPGVYLIGIESVLVQHFNATGLPIMIPLFWVATLIFNVTLTFALVPVYGARGAALSSTASYTMIFLLVALYFRARTRKPFSEILLLSGPELRALFTRGGRRMRISY